MVDLRTATNKVKLAMDHEVYALNNPNNKIGILLRAKHGDVIWYFKAGDKNNGWVSINVLEIVVCKYKEMLKVRF